MFFEMYNQAYDCANKAAKAFKYERPNDYTAFTQPGYWDPSRGGLLCGERLHVALKHLETAYQERKGYDYEIVKHPSLKQLEPLALILFRETRSCKFNVPEALFDMDFPGQYLPRIKSVALSTPCIIGLYTSINCVLQMKSHKYRVTPATAPSYLESSEGTQDERFSTANVPITSIAVSSAQDDSGQFELNFNDERYVPFEGAHAISSWCLELPSSIRQLSYQSISDIVMHFKYTSIDGGEALKSSALASLASSHQAVESSRGLHALLDVKNDYAKGGAD